MRSSRRRSDRSPHALNPMFPADPPACPSLPQGSPPSAPPNPGLSTRRNFFARAAAVPLAIAAPSIALAIPVPYDWRDPWRELARKAENPALEALLPELHQACDQYVAVATALRDVIERYEQIAPVLPDDLVYKWSDPSPFNWCVEGEQDIEGRPVYPPDIVDANGNRRGLHQRKILTADLLRTEGLEDQPNRRTRIGKEVRRRLAIAEKYEAAITAAKELSGFSGALIVKIEAECALNRIAERVLEENAQTLVGLHIKARAMAALARIEKNKCGAHDTLVGPCTGLRHGVQFAYNVARVVGLGA
jgi:hypothetical protein